ncbi:protein pinocchio-like isoform X1 [Limulus polyphemus]|uniref:Protein pinocchio-like isoform X1 n=1 Tax=Limulus polyphemus TaxID=6850 RepID=A0ABM1B0L7_LIMPO|nr:protein pinocchio-like isoform X1 [Limulus polyphemus]
MIEYNAFYPGYDLDEMNMVFDVDDPDFSSDLTMSNMNHCGLNIRHSKSDPLLQLKAHFCCSDFDNHNVQELALLSNWENLRDNQVAFSWDSDCISDTDSVNQVFQENNMLTIEGLRNHYNSCFSCGVNWYEDHVSLDCPECGGYAMQRPCPECDGQCESTWRRDLAASHNTKQAKWEGECRKSRTQTNQKLFHHNDNCEVLTNAMKNLKTSI